MTAVVRMSEGERLVRLVASPRVAVQRVAREEFNYSSTMCMKMPRDWLADCLPLARLNICYARLSRLQRKMIPGEISAMESYAYSGATEPIFTFINQLIQCGLTLPMLPPCLSSDVKARTVSFCAYVGLSIAPADACEVTLLTPAKQAGFTILRPREELTVCADD